MPPLITVAIPADNRPEELGALLDTVLAPEDGHFEVLMIEDASPHQAEIRAVVEGTAARRTDLRIRFGQRIELFRYFPEDRHFPAGARTMRTCFRRCVSIAGFNIHAASAPRTPTLDSRYTQ